ncbi:MAG: flagellar protein FlbB [Alphaproteobacteria bacterium]|nr:flagellar protein FlbB [Alphaproteobacteria bacterium]
MYDQLLEKLKILPLLVVVASLAFAVRLGEVIIDPASSQGSASAQIGTPQDTPPPKSDLKSTTTTSTEGTSPEMVQQPTTIDWQDSDENDIEFSSVKAELFETLAKRRKNLDARELNVENKEALLKAAELQIERKYQELETIRNEIQALLKQQTSEEKARITSLVKIYEGMKAKDAAKIFNTLDMDILINVMGGMSERKLAPIMAAMDPDRARSVTIFLAEEKSLPTLSDQ